MSDHHSHGGHHGFDPDRLMEMEERRRTLMDPDRILRRFLSDGEQTLLDIGCGAGYFALPAASLLSTGRVYASDINPRMVEVTLERARKQGLENIEGIVAPADKLPLEDGTVDAVLFAMVFHDIAEQSEALAEARRVLTPQGQLFFVEWDRVATDFGPPMEIRIAPEELREIVTTHGFRVSTLQADEEHPGPYYLHAQAE